MNNQQNDDMDRQIERGFRHTKSGQRQDGYHGAGGGLPALPFGVSAGAVIDCDFPQYSPYEMRERDSRRYWRTNT